MSNIGLNQYSARRLPCGKVGYCAQLCPDKAYNLKSKYNHIALCYAFHKRKQADKVDYAKVKESIKKVEAICLHAVNAD